MVSERRGRMTGTWEQALVVVPPNSNLQADQPRDQCCMSSFTFTLERRKISRWRPTEEVIEITQLPDFHKTPQRFLFLQK